MKNKFFKSKNGDLPLPVFFPDATRAVLKTLDSEDIRKTMTPGILINTYHLWKGLNEEILHKFDGIRKFMDWGGWINFRLRRLSGDECDQEESLRGKDNG